MVEAWFQPVVVEVLRKWKTGWGNGGDFLKRIPLKFDLFATESSKIFLFPSGVLSTFAQAVLHPFLSGRLSAFW